MTPTRSPTRHLHFTRTSVALVALVAVLVLTLPAASALTAFSDDFAGGVSNWTWSSSTGSVTQDCSVQSCAMKELSICCSVHLNAARVQDFPLSGTMVYSFAFRGNGVTGNTDVDIQLIFDNNDGIEITPTDSGSAGNNGVSVGTFKTGLGQSNFGSWGSANTWYRGEVTINATARSYVMKLYDGSGGLLATSHTITWNAGPTKITQLVFHTVTWSNDVPKPFWVDNVTMSSPSAPSAPLSLAATSGAGAASLTWLAPSDNGGSPVLNYTILRATSPGSETTYRTGVTTTSFNDTGLANGTTYYYKVAAVNALGTGAASSEVSVATWTVPGAPTNLTAASGAGSAALTWLAPSANGGSPTLNYTILRATSPGNETTYRTGVNTTAFNDTGLANGTTYYYKVAAVNAIGTGAASNEISVATWSVPGAPGGLTAVVPQTPGAIDLNWTAPGVTGGSAITGYRVYRDGAAVLDTNASTLVFHDTNLAARSTHGYQVSAKNTLGEGALSVSVNATTLGAPLAPANVTAARGPGAYDITVTWSAPDNGGAPITSYAISRSVSGGAMQLLATTNASARAFVDNATVAGALHSYSLVATNLVGAGNASALANATAYDVPSAPTALHGTIDGAGAITLAWSKPSFNGGLPVEYYVVYRGLNGATPTQVGYADALEARSFTDANVTLGSLVKYVVTAANERGEGNGSAAWSTTAATPPGQVSDLSATAGPGRGEVSLAWSAPADGGSAITSYQILDGGVQVGTSSLPGFVVGSLGDGVTRSYQVAALNDRGAGPRSASASVTTLAGPSAPRDFTATGAENGIDLAWSAPSNDGGHSVVDYVVRRGTSAGAQQVIVTLPAVQTGFHDPSPGSGVAFYTVSARNDIAEGAPTSTLCATLSTSSAMCPSRAVVAATRTLPADWNKDTLGLTVASAGRADGLADEDMGTFAITPTTFQIDMGDLANMPFVGHPGAAYTVSIWAQAHAWKAGGAAPRAGEVVAHVNLNGEHIGDLITGNPTLDGDTWRAGLTEQLSAPANIVRAGKLNTIDVFPTDAYASSGGDVDHGWSVKVDAGQIQLVAPPVVILHGWTFSISYDNGTGLDDWQVPLAIDLTAEAMTRFHQDPWQWATSYGTAFEYLAYNRKADFRVSTLDLSNAVQSLKARTDYTGKIWIAGHSMGGLVSRWYIEQGVTRPNGDPPAPSQIGSTQVAKLAMLATPNLGSEDADIYITTLDDARPAFPYYFGTDGQPLCPYVDDDLRADCSPGINDPSRLYAYRDWSTFPYNADGPHQFGRAYRSNGVPAVADFDLLPVGSNNVLTQLNAQVLHAGPHWHPAGVDYFVASGEGAFLTNCDVAVCHESATVHDHIDAAVIRAFTQDAVSVDPPFHVTMTTYPATVCYLTQFYFQDRSVNCELLQPGPHGGSSAQAAAIVPAAPQTEPALAGHVLDGATLDAPLVMTRSSEATISATITGEGRNATILSLARPDGTTIAEADAAAAGIQVMDSDGAVPGSRVVAFRIDGPADGTWHVLAQGPAGSGNVTVFTRLSIVSDLVVDPLTLGTPYVPDSMGLLSVNMTLAGAPLSGATVTALVTSDAALPVTLTLHDDGSGGDETANDGVYTASYTGSVGSHEAIVTATGTADGVAFQRHVASNIWFSATPPTIDHAPDITAEATSAAGAVVTYAAPATHDATDGNSVASCLPTSGASFRLGDTLVTCVARNSAGLAAAPVAFHVTVLDTSPPAIDAHPDIAEEATVPAGAVVSYDPPSSHDAVDGEGIASCAPESGSVFALGATAVACAATDAAGNTASATFTIRVRDTTPPTIDPLAPVAAEATGPDGAAVTYARPATHDAVDGDGLATCAPASGSTFALGDTTVTCAATDAAQNDAAPVSATFHVVDTTAPAIDARSDITAEATAPAGAVVGYDAPRWHDAVDGAGVATCAPASGSTFPLGATTVACTRTDAAGNTGAGSFQVVVRDTTPPTIDPVHDITVEATGASGAVVTYATPPTHDAVDGAGFAQCAPASGSTFPQGATTVTCVATDAAGNAATPATFVVRVSDATPPSIDPHADITEEATEPAGAVVSYDPPASHDAVDGDGIASCAPASGSVFPLGSTTIACAATDASGNEARSTFDVRVQDTTAPSVDAHDDITAEAAGANGALVTYDAPVWRDAVDGTGATTCAPPSGWTFPLGNTAVTCAKTDAAGNTGSSTFSVSVRDTTPPTIDPADDITAEATDASGALVSYRAPATRDAVDGVGTAACAPASGSSFPQGATTVTCQATDAAGNVALPVTFVVRVRDASPPTIHAHADLTVEATSPVGAIASYDPPATHDAVDGDGVATCDPESGAVFPLGATIVSCSVTDASGNVARSSFRVVVQDTTAPAIDAHPDITEEATASAGAVVSYDAPASHDAVGGDALARCAPASGSVFPLGETAVVCSAADDAGNDASSSFLVRVQDTTAPSIDAHSDITQEATSPGGAVVSYDAPATADAVDGAGRASCDPASGSTFALGATVVRCAAADAAGNGAASSFTVRVVDTTAPALVVPEDVILEATGPAGASFAFAANATDAVSDPIVACDPASGSTFGLGSTTVACTASDAAGNVASAAFRVRVVDTTPPTIASHADVRANASSLAGGIVAFDPPATADVVDGAGVATCAPASGTLFPIGNTTVTCNATDAAGNNASNVTFVVRVIFPVNATLRTDRAEYAFTDALGQGIRGVYHLQASDGTPIVNASVTVRIVRQVPHVGFTDHEEWSGATNATGDFVFFPSTTYELPADYLLLGSVRTPGIEGAASGAYSVRVG